MRDDLLTAVLAELNGSSPDIEGSAVLTGDGRVQAGALPPHVDAQRLAAMGAAMLALGERTAADLGRGALEQVIVRGRDGCMVLTHAGPDTVVATLCTTQAKLGLVLLDARRAAEALHRGTAM